MPSKRTRQLLALGLVFLHLIVIGLAVDSWSEIYGYRWFHLYGGAHLPPDALTLFPLLGLLAFSLMWIHYVAAAVNRFYKNAFDLKKYFQWTGYVVLALIVLHPGLLTYGLWRQGFGLPPGSELKFVGKSGELALLFALTAWLIFITYEFINRMQHTRFWPVMVGLNDGAMFLIFFHASWLGTSQQLSWFHKLWLFYGIVLVLCIAQRLYFVYHRQRTTSGQTGA